MASSQIWSPADMHQKLAQWKENKRGGKGTQREVYNKRPLTNKKKKKASHFVDGSNDENVNSGNGQKEATRGNKKANKFGFRKQTPKKAGSEKKRKTPDERQPLSSAKKLRTPNTNAKNLASITVEEIASKCLPSDEETKALLKKKVCVGLRKHELSKKLSRLQGLIKETRASYAHYISGVRVLVEKCQQREAALAVDADEYKAQNSALMAGRADLEHTISNLREEQKTHVRNITDLIDSKKELTDEVTRLSAHGTKLSEDLKCANGQNEAANAEIARLRSDVEAKKAAYETVKAEFTAAKADMEAEIVRVKEEQIAHQERVEATMETKVREVREQLAAENTRAQVLDAQRTALEAQVKKLDDSNTASLQVKENLQARLNELTVTEGRQAAQIEGLQNSLQQLKQEMASKETTFQQSMSNFNKIIGQNEQRQSRMDAEKDELNSKLQALTESHTSLQASSRDLEAKCARVEEQLAAATAGGAATRDELAEALASIQLKEKALSELEETHATIVRDYDTAKASYAESRLAWEDSHSMLTAQVQEGTKAMEALQGKLQATEHQLTAKQAQLTTTEEQVRRLEIRAETFQNNIPKNMEEMMTKFSAMVEDRESMSMKLSSHDNLEKDYSASQQEVQRLQKLLMESETARRKLHNRVQELRGNIRVFVRVRPFLPGDGIEYTEQKQSMRCMPDGQGVNISDRNKQHKFSFDRVFKRGSTQGAVFGEVSELVQSALDGYNVCIFSYGQTGSGKTYTMQGLLDDPEQRGLIPRSMEQILATSQKMAQQGWSFDFKASFVEIYNEQVRDLLRTSEAPSSCDIKRNAKGKTFVAGVQKMGMENMEDVGEIMRLAASKRAVGCTSMNSVSSRSHSVFTIFITGTCEQHGKRIVGALNLCDLAGSERLARSKATGAQLKETQAINKSLSALADVFMALKGKSKHIPYRNSKLTYLLEPCFSKDGKTMMLVNVSPTQLSSQETTCSLRFAQQVNQCQLGKATAQVQDLKAGKATPAKGSKDGGAAKSGARTKRARLKK